MLLQTQDDEVAFEFHMEPEPADQKAGPRILQGPAPPPIFVPRDPFEAPPRNLSSWSPPHTDTVFTPFYFDTIQDPAGGSVSPNDGRASMSAMDASSGQATPKYCRSSSSGRSTPTHKLLGAVSMGTTPPDALPSFQFSPTKSPTSPPFPSSLPSAVSMGTAPFPGLQSQASNPIPHNCGSRSNKPRSRSSLDEGRFSYVVRHKSGMWSGADDQGLMHAHSAGTTFALAAPSIIAHVAEDVEEEVSAEYSDAVIARPVTPYGPDLPSNQDMMHASLIAPVGISEPVKEPPVATGFHVPEKPAETSQSTPPLPPKGALGTSGTNMLRLSAGKRAATMWGSAMDLVGLGSQTSSRCSSEEDLMSSKVASSSKKRGGLSEEMGILPQDGVRAQQSWGGVSGNRVPSVSDLVTLMWKDSPSSGNSQSSFSKQSTPPLPGRRSPLSSFKSSAPSSADGKLGKGRRRPSWRGLRHIDQPSPSNSISSVSTHAVPSPLPANPLLARAKGSLTRGKTAFPSAPNLADLDTSRLVTDTGRAHNLNKFESVYQMTESLGTGGYAVVRKCVHLASGEEFAVKVMQLNTQVEEKDEQSDDDSDVEDDDEDNSMSLREIINELSMMCRLDHPNIITIHEFFIQDNHCFIVMQLLEGEELMDALVELGAAEGRNDGGTGNYGEVDVRTVMASLIDAVSYMHEMGITHRDIKLENLVLAKKRDLSSVVIVDFGLAKAARAREKMEETCGTPWYSSPELLNGDPYTQAVDLWSLGIAMFVLLSGDFPFDHEDEDELMDLIIDGDFQMTGPKWDIISRQAKDLIRGLLEPKPTDRLTAVEAIEHPWFTGDIEEQASSSVLHHAHMRLTRLVECAPGRLPVALFSPGEWIAKQGERGKEVYMILDGEAEVLRDREAGEELRVPSNSKFDPSKYADHVRVRTLRKGNFAGMLAQSLVQSRSGLCSVSRQGDCDPNGSYMGRNGNLSAHMHEVLSAATLEVSASTVPITIPEEPENISSSPSLTTSHDAGVLSIASSAPSDSLSSQATSTANHSPSAASHLATPESGSSTGGTWINTALKSIGIVTRLIRLRRNWVGHRRTASIRAVTQVKALVLNREDMHWAVEHDYRLTHELQDAMKKQRKKLRAKAREAKKLREQQKQQINQE